MDNQFDICRVFEISKFDIARLTCIPQEEAWSSFLGVSIPQEAAWSSFSGVKYTSGRSLVQFLRCKVYLRKKPVPVSRV